MHMHIQFRLFNVGSNIVVEMEQILNYITKNNTEEIFMKISVQYFFGLIPHWLR